MRHITLPKRNLHSIFLLKTNGLFALQVTFHFARKCILSLVNAVKTHFAKNTLRYDMQGKYRMSREGSRASSYSLSTGKIPL